MELNTSCTICFEEFTLDELESEQLINCCFCQCNYHKKCLHEWYHRLYMIRNTFRELVLFTCPNCRKSHKVCSNCKHYELINKNQIEYIRSNGTLTTSRNLSTDHRIPIVNSVILCCFFMGFTLILLSEKFD